MESPSNSERYWFKITQPLGPPSIYPPEKDGKIAVSVQFIIPGLVVSKKDETQMADLFKLCSDDIWGVSIKTVENSTTKEKASLMTVAFYFAETNRIKEELNTAIQFESRKLVERFLSLLSFFTGIKLCAQQIQPTIKRDGHYSLILRQGVRTEMPNAKIEFPKISQPSDKTFSALSWLRRGLAEKDPIDTFSAFMVCLQIIARALVKLQGTDIRCKNCGEIVEKREPSITSLVKHLVVTDLKAPEEIFEKLWKARNAFVAHGNADVTPEIILHLTELKFEAADLAFKGIKLLLGIPQDSSLSPNQAFFITDAFLYVD
jgi:hypothetical protein